MRMAKVQKATLDPTQVSGRCGRLKCCLRYEHVGYEELDKQLPRTGIRISTNHGDGIVVNRQILTQLVQIRDDAGTLQTVVAEDITAVNVPAPKPGEAPERRGAGTSRAKARRPSRSGNRDRGPAKPKPADSPAREPNTKQSGAVKADGERPAGDADSAKTTGTRHRRRKGRRRRGRRRGGSTNGSSGTGASTPSSD